MRSGALFGSLKAALMRWARVSTGMYSTSTSAPSWDFSKAATAASTTFCLGLLPTSWKSQTRSVPVFLSPSELVSEVCGAQAVAVRPASTRAAAGAAIRAESFIRNPYRSIVAFHATCVSFCTTGRRLRGPQHADKWSQPLCDHAVQPVQRTGLARERRRPRGARLARPGAVVGIRRTGLRDEEVRGRADYFLPLSLPPLPLSLSPPAPMDS